MAAAVVPEAEGAVLARIRSTAPLVQCLTNQVVSNFTANALLALGASVAMVDVPGEAGPFAGVASGVLVNLGTPHAEQRAAMREAATTACSTGTPWVLDPVAVGSLSVRTSLAAELLALSPTVVRGNPSEILALAGRGRGGRGVDSVTATDDALDAARFLASEHGSVVTVSGPVDLVTDGDRVVHVDRGHPLLTVVTGGGCALGAIVAAACAVEHDALAATVAAVTGWGAAAEAAAERAHGPGSFAVALLDELGAL
jgi:hydroxyethylthiazole kinase